LKRAFSVARSASVSTRRCERPEFSASLQHDCIKGGAQLRVPKWDLRLTHLRFCRLAEFVRSYYPRRGGIDSGFGASSFALLASYTGLVMLSCSHSADTHE
jgi:hypothetical protein